MTWGEPDPKRSFWRKLACVLGLHEFRLVPVGGDGPGVRECKHCRDRPGWR